MYKTTYSAMTIFGVIGFLIIWALNNAYPH
jgi:hypothetical protein